jgi:8-oxo-dGTP pyrophosphatase MutT (NUDIX family)
MKEQKSRWYDSTMTEAIPEFGTPREGEERRDGACAVVFDPNADLFAAGKLEAGFLHLFGGGVEPGEDPEQGIVREVIEESGLYDFADIKALGQAMAHYRNHQKQVNRVTKVTSFLLILRSADTVPAQHEAHEQFSLMWVTAEQLLADWRAHNAEGDLDHWIHFLGIATTRLKELGFGT